MIMTSMSVDMSPSTMKVLASEYGNRSCEPIEILDLINVFRNQP